MISLKTDEEIEIMREGGKRLAHILHTLIDSLEVGMPVQDINERAGELIKESGGTAAFLNYRPKGASNSYPSNLCVSVNDAIVHGIPSESDYILKEGDLVTLDIGLVYEGLIVDTAYTKGVGDVDLAGKKLLEAGREALGRGVDAAIGGNRIGDIGNAIESYVKGEGYSVFKELVGHGVGYELHEPPHVPNYGEAGTGGELEPGMTIAIEPMIGEGKEIIKQDSDGWTYRTADGSRSVHFEHTIAITEGEAEILTQQ